LKLDEDAAARPVSRVVTILEDMVATLEKEAKQDEDTYEAMRCWCETGYTSKTLALANNKDHVNALEASIDGYAAGSSRLHSELEKLAYEVKENEEALATSTKLREEQITSFSAEEKDMLNSINAMGGALAALSKHQAASFLQTGRRQVETAISTLRHTLHKHGVQFPEQRKVLSSLALLQTQDYTQEYAPQSSAVFGMLQGMKETFENNLAKSQGEETRNQADFEGVKAGKTEELAAGRSQADSKTQELANTDEKNAQASEDVVDTQATIAADTEFLENLKTQCKNVDAEYAERTSTRRTEIAAVSKALGFLSSDEAKDLFRRTLGSAAFIQKRSIAASLAPRREAASRILIAAATKSRNPRIALLALKLRSPTGAFKTVRAAIKEDLRAMDDEKEEEIKHKDYCVDALQENGKELDQKSRAKETLEMQVADLTESIASREKEVKELTTTIDETHVELKQATEDRQKEGTDFQTTVADQRATQKLLDATLKVLKGVYSDATLLQESSDAAPPAGFNSQEQSAPRKGVVGMIQQIIDNAKAMEGDAVKAEEESQQAYENFVNEINQSIVTMQKSIAAKKADKAKSEGQKVEDSESLSTVVEEIGHLDDGKKDLHDKCDWALANFGVRQQGRDKEVQALKESFNIISLAPDDEDSPMGTSDSEAEGARLPEGWRLR